MKKVDNKTAAIEIIQKLRSQGHQAYLVGGCVRDMLLGRKNPKEEHDVTTSARTQEVIKLFPRTLLVGAKFGVVLVGLGGHWIEVASFRSDQSYSDGRHPDSVRIGSMQEDAERRDFTINGMYYDPIEEKIIDLVGGQADIEKRVIRAIGQPEARFREDHLRMLRAIRFAGQLNDFQIETATAQAIRQLAGEIVKISAERILEEFKKLFSSPRRAIGLKLADELGLLKYILPQVHTLPTDAFTQTLEVVNHLPDETQFETVLAGLLHLVGWARPTGNIQIRSRMSLSHYTASAKTADQVCRQLTCSNQERMRTVWLVQLLPLLGQADQLSLAHIKRLMIYERYEGLVNLYQARVKAGLEPQQNLDHLLSQAGKISPASLEHPPLLGGQDLTTQLALTPGPAYQRILDEVYDAQLNELIQTKEEALAMAKKLI
ncbi:MAG: CCA tRNA nucleotidyltransferase [Phycisphaerae bacterium]